MGTTAASSKGMQLNPNRPLRVGDVGRVGEPDDKVRRRPLLLPVTAIDAMQRSDCYRPVTVVGSPWRPRPGRSLSARRVLRERCFGNSEPFSSCVTVGFGLVQG